jgi:hypothetical protein
MFSDVLKEVTGALDRRFLMNVFFPSLIFWGLLIVVVVATRADLTTTAKVWNDQETFVKTIQCISFIAGVTFFAYVLNSQLTTIFRYYEGYWNSSWGRPFRNWGQAWHWSRYQQLDAAANAGDDSAYERIYLYYPPANGQDQLLPTRFGNILKNAEMYPKERYEIDSVLIWPHLYNLFPDKFVQIIAETRGAVDLTLVISLLSGTFAIITGIYLVFTGVVWWLFLLCFFGGLFVAKLSYLGALGNAVLYAQQIKVGFDLYRNDLLKQMRLPLPRTAAEEKVRWCEVNKHFYRNVQGDLECRDLLQQSSRPGMWRYKD